MAVLFLLLHLSCSDCHAEGLEPERACAICHDQTVGAFRENDHPIIPGKVDCISCHVPHDPKAFQVPLHRSELCLSCHEDK